MPSKTAKQHRLMEAVAHNPAFAKRVGISQSVGKEFVEADKGKKFRIGGLPASINKPDTQHGMIDMPYKSVRRLTGMKKGGAMKEESKAMMKKEVAFMKKKGAPASMIKHEEAEMKGMKRGGGVKKYSAGGGVEHHHHHYAKGGHMMRSKMDIAKDQMGMAPFGKGGKAHHMKHGGVSHHHHHYAAGGKIKETMGPRNESQDVEHGSNTKLAHGEHGVQKRGHTRGTVVRMASGGSVRAHGEHSIQLKGHTRGKIC